MYPHGQSPVHGITRNFPSGLLTLICHSPSDKLELIYMYMKKYKDAIIHTNHNSAELW